MFTTVDELSETVIRMLRMDRESHSDIRMVAIKDVQALIFTMDAHFTQVIWANTQELEELEER